MSAIIRYKSAKKNVTFRAILRYIPETSMIKKFLLFFLLLSLGYVVQAQFYMITGKVTDASIEPLAAVNIKIQGGINGTSTDANGNYTLKVEKGNYEVVFTHLGYKTIKKNITVLHDVTLNAILEEDATSLKEVELTTKRTDRSREIIKEVIANKEKYVAISYSCEMYIKAMQEPQEAKFKHKKDSAEKAQKKFIKDSLQKVEEMDSTTKAYRKKKERDSLEHIALTDTSSKEYKKRIAAIRPPDPMKGIAINLAEVIIQKNYEYPDKIKEVRTAVKQKGDETSLFYLTSTEGEFNFYQNLVRITSLSESPFQSPISTGGLLVYKYKLLRSRTENGLKIYTIKVSPNAIGNALVTGEIEIIDSLWCIKSMHLSFPKFHLAEYDEFTMDANFAPDSNGLWLCSKQEFNFKTKIGGAKSSGRTVVYYNKYEVKKFEKKFFNNELSATEQDAYEKDTAFWNTRRKEPLTEKEVRFIYVSDSIKAAHEKKEYLDSVDKVLNKITFTKVIWFGQQHYNREKELTLNFDPLWIVYNPFGIGGARVRYGLGIDKKFKNKTTFFNYTNLSYGLINKDVKGDITLSRTYNPYKHAFFYIHLKRNFDVINPFDSWLSIFRRANFYVSNGVRVYHRIELFNGMYFNAGVEYSKRSSISNYEFNPLFDSIYENYKYKPAAFKDYNAFYSNILFSYTPFQKYLREPKEKIILGSKYPSFIVEWRKGIPNVLGSAINFDYLEYRIEWQVKMGLFGNSRLNISSGKFYNTKVLPYIDYKFQNRIGPLFFANPLYTFQALDSTYITLNRFYAAHYYHRFNGALLNKVPILKMLQLSESAGGGLLYSKEHNLFYFEMFAGIDRQFILFSERARFGLYVVQAVSNNFKSTPQLKITLDFYDRVNNVWSY